MWKSPRRIALVSTGVVLASAGLLGIGWLADWLPIRFEAPESGELVQGEFDENAFPGLPSQGSTDVGGVDEFPPETLAPPPSDDPIFTSQNEPGAMSDTPGSALANAPSRTDWTLDSIPRPPAELADSGQQPASSRTMPEQFPPVAASSRPEFSSVGQTGDPFKPERSPGGPVSQAGFHSEFPPSNVTGSTARSGGQIFRSDTAQTLPQSRTFPAQVAFIDEPGTGSSETSGNASGVQSAVVETTVPSATAPAAVDLSEIDALIESGDYVNAHRHLSTLYWNQSNLHPSVMQRLDRNAQLIYFRPQPHFLEPYTIQSGDLLQRIAPRYRINWEYLVTLNNIDPRRIRPGQKLKVIKGPFSAFVDLSDHVLTVHCHGFYVRRFPVGIGKDGATPTGRFTVLDRVPNPQYTDPNGRVIAGDDPTNPLGDYWLDLGDSYGIHGTIEPDSIGKAASRGCIRMHNGDVSQVYDFLVRGSEVAIRP